jgi:hypothetical protein
MDRSLLMLALTCACAHVPRTTGSADEALARTAPRHIPVDCGGGIATGDIGHPAASVVAVPLAAVDALVDEALHGDCRAREAQAFATEAFQRERTERLSIGALELTRRAAADARAGNCATARSLEGAVDDEDPEVHDTIFMRDAAILNCIGRAAPTTRVTVQAPAVASPPR